MKKSITFFIFVVISLCFVEANATDRFQQLQQSYNETKIIRDDMWNKYRDATILMQNIQDAYKAELKKIAQEKKELEAQEKKNVDKTTSQTGE